MKVGWTAGAAGAGSAGALGGNLLLLELSDLRKRQLAGLGQSPSGSPLGVPVSLSNLLHPGDNHRAGADYSSAQLRLHVGTREGYRRADLVNRSPGSVCPGSVIVSGSRLSGPLDSGLGAPGARHPGECPVTSIFLASRHLTGRGGTCLPEPSLRERIVSGQLGPRTQRLTIRRRGP